MSRRTKTPRSRVWERGAWMITIVGFMAACFAAGTRDSFETFVLLGVGTAALAARLGAEVLL